MEPISAKHYLAPIEILGTMKQGQSLPMLMQCCAPESQSIETFFVKVASRRTSQSPEVLATEYLSMLLCKEIGLSTLTPLIAHLSPEICSDLTLRFGLEPEDTFAFAVEFIKNLNFFNAKKDSERITTKIRARILALDVLLSNGDRVPENPNLAWRGQNLFIFDFGASCNFRPNAVDRDFENNFQSGLTILESHVLFDPKLAPHISSEFNLILRTAAAAELAMGSKYLPASWQNQARLFVEYIEYCNSNRLRFVKEIERALKAT